MRKILLVVLAALLVSVAIYSGVGADSYFLLRIGDWAMQMRLFVALILLLITLVVMMLFWRIFRGVVLGSWPAAWRRKREKDLTRNAIENLALSNWTSARKELIRVANQTEKPVPFIMLSAQVSEAMGELEEAKEIYNQSITEFPDWSYVARKRLCQIALAEGDMEEVENLLPELKKERAGDPQLLIFEAGLAEEKRDWDGLKNLLVAAHKKSEVRSQIAPIERRFLQNRLHQRLGAPELLELNNYVSRTENVSPDTIGQLARQLAIRGQSKEAEMLARKSLDKTWDDSLISLYAELEAQSPTKQLKAAESWFVGREDSVALLDALQRISVRAGDDAKADHYAEKLKQVSSKSEEAGQLPSLVNETVQTG